MERDLSLPSMGRAYADELLAQRGVFDDGSMVRRYIEGVCTSDRENARGRVFSPAGATAELPIPLLFSHNWDLPIGRVVELQITPRGLWFRARIADAKLEWAQTIWESLTSGRIAAVSVFGWDLPPYDGKWALFEVSACAKGACPDATIDIVRSEVHGVTYLDGRRATIHRQTNKHVEPSHRRRSTDSGTASSGVAF